MPQEHSSIKYGDINMAFDKFYIAPIGGGLQLDVKPFLIPDDAFSRLNNAYIFRGRVRKRFGTRLMNGIVADDVAPLYSRLRVQIGTTDASGELAFTTLPRPTANGVLNKGALFSVGDEVYTVTTVPLVVGNANTLSTISTSVGTVRLDSTGPNIYQFRLVGATPSLATLPVYWYPALPVMGLITYQQANTLYDPVYAFDQNFAYQFTGGAWARLGTGVWNGTDSQFFWGANWIGGDTGERYLFVTNNVPSTTADGGIKYWTGTVWGQKTLPITGSINLEGCLILVVFKNHLIALNTIEDGVRYINRARWAAFGNPLNEGGTGSVIAWRQDQPGQGFAIDAETNEDIVSCQFVRDRLVVFFERSTWELAFTGNQLQPFTWQRLNTELGADATFSSVPFDQVTLTLGNTGIHACDGVSVVRIDNEIPDSVWQARAGSTNIVRIHGIRDYFAEQVYWTFPNISADPSSSTYPNKVLVYNYSQKTWAFNDDSFTTFGLYYAASQSSITWDSTNITWDNTDITWDSGVSQTLSQYVIAGNQEGFVSIVDPAITLNAPSLQVTDITATSQLVSMTAYNHNLNPGDYIQLKNIVVYKSATTTYQTIDTSTEAYLVTTITDANVFEVVFDTIIPYLADGYVYVGGGWISRVSKIDIITKQFNFYLDADRNAYIQKVDCLIDRTDSGEIAVDYRLGSSDQGNVQNALANGSQLGTGILETTAYTLYPQELTQERLWHPVYFQADSNGIQLRFYFSDDQMANLAVAQSAFQLHAMAIYATATSTRAQ
jgi:hypothetical protein